MRFLHPATVLFLFHFLIVTLRLFTLSAGAPLLFDDPFWHRVGFSRVTMEELNRAAFLADLGLFTSTLGFIMADDKHKRWKKVNDGNQQSQESTPNLLIDKRLVITILIPTFILGIAGLFTNSYIPGVQGRVVENLAIGEWQTSSWVSITQTWVGITIMTLIFIYGFRRSLVVFVSFYFIFQLYQGYHRFRIILPFILLMNVYLLQKQLRWPPRWMVFAGIIIMLLFFPAKRIGDMMQQGVPTSEMITEITEYLINLPTNSSSDLLFLDQFAMSLSLTDNSRFYYGSTYLPVLVLPVPRPLWPEKPELAFFLKEIQTPDRPIGVLGMIMTYYGESYLNFGIVGIIVVPYLLAYWLGRFFYAVKYKPSDSISLLIYIITISSLVQVYRDGLTSLVLFVVMNNIPIIIIAVAHLLLIKRSKKHLPRNTHKL